jgi:hypothetical protein
MLLLLDDASSVEQVRPLLPGSPTCAVLITSRHALPTLEGVRPLHLGILPHDEVLGQEAGTSSLGGRRGRFRLLDGPASLLPAAERARFVAEAQGNLGDCDCGWQRVDHLVCLVLGMPRLAWMMRRDGRRRRA